VSEQVHTAEESVNPWLAQLKPAMLGSDKTVFHGMGDLHDTMEMDDAGRALEGVSGAHEHFQRLGTRSAAFQFEQAAGEDGSLGFRFGAEELQHRDIAQVLGIARIHMTLRIRAENNN
jgi:hypothetical protein